MTSRPFVKASGGIVHVADTNLDHSNLFEVLAAWNFAQSKADEDFDARRVDHLEQSAPVAQSAADDVRDAAGLALTWQAALALADQLATHAALARQQEQQADPVRFTNPMMRRA